MSDHYALPATPWGRRADRLGDLVIASVGWVRKLALGVLLGIGVAAAIIATVTAESRAPGLILGGGLILLGAGVPLWRWADPQPDRMEKDK